MTACLLVGILGFLGDSEFSAIFLMDWAMGNQNLVFKKEANWRQIVFKIFTAIAKEMV